MQIEINRGLYMDERSYRKNDGFSSVCGSLSQTIIDFAKILLDFKK
jgi:N-formylglutamate amidohydrolase